MTENTLKVLPPRFESIRQIDIPLGRNGKHNKIVTEILSDIDLLGPGRALKVPIAAMSNTKENVRSALNHAARRKGIEVASSSDQDFLYIWKVVHEHTRSAVKGA